MKNNKQSKNFNSPFFPEVRSFSTVALSLLFVLLLTLFCLKNASLSHRHGILAGAKCTSAKLFRAYKPLELKSYHAFSTRCAEWMSHTNKGL